MQTLVLIVGPAAAGKATVGLALSQLAGFPLLHNHEVAEPVAKITGWCGRLFETTMTDVRKTLLGVAANSGISLITTFMFAFDYAPDAAFVAWVKERFEANGGRVVFVELTASLDTRLAREGTEPRITMKPSKRDVEESRLVLLMLERHYAFNSHGDFPYPDDWLLLDTETQSPEACALAIADRFSLTTP